MSNVPQANCAICRQFKMKLLDETPQGMLIECPRCGQFRCTREAIDRFRNLPLERRVVVSGWLWENNRYAGQIPLIDGTNVDALLSARPLPFAEKIKRLLIHMSEHTTHLNQVIDVSGARIMAMVEASRPNDVVVLTNYLRSEELISSPGPAAGYVQVSGFLKVDEWRQPAISSMQGFVAMWFDASMHVAWEHGLRRGIANAGYKPLRIDKKEHANDISDEIIAEIRRSRFVVADYTGQRGGVYYEAGYAAGRGLTVINTCRKDEVEKLHFDIRQYNCIDWTTPDELAHRLQARIEAVIGDGPQKSSKIVRDA
jgi:hypothetical protein